MGGWGGGQFSRLLAAEVCACAVVIHRVPRYNARLLATHSTRMFPLHFPYRASPCAIRFQLSYTNFMWDEPVIRDRTANRLDILLHGREVKTSLLIDIAVRYDSKFNTKQNEKLSKYKDQETEISRMWKCGLKLCRL